MDGFVDISVVKIYCLEASVEAFFSQVIHAYQSHIVELSKSGSRAEGMWKREKPIKQTATAGTQTNGILFLNTFELKNKDLTKGGSFFQEIPSSNYVKKHHFYKIMGFLW